MKGSISMEHGKWTSDAKHSIRTVWVLHQKAVLAEAAPLVGVHHKS
jgi:hypothetical protein